MPRRGFHIGPNGETYSPSLRAPEKIDLEKDCTALRDAMKGLGTNEDKIIEVLGHRNLEQRLRIRDHYKSMFGTDLVEKLKSELGGNFENLVHMLLSTWPMINAYSLYKSIKGSGTNEATIVEILCTASNSEIEEIKHAYVEYPSRTLEKDLINDLSGNFERLVVALLQGQRHELTEEDAQRLRRGDLSSVIDAKAVHQDVADLYDAGEGHLGTDEAQFIRILATRDIWHLQAVANLYEKVDLKDISRQFAADQGKSLAEWIGDDTSGDYRKMLLALLGEEWQK